MTLEELWNLFPIVLAPHSSSWKEWAEDEIRQLKKNLVEFCPTISHIGSTAIPKIQAKPIIDLLVEVATESNWNKLRDVMEASGYICMARTQMRMSFNKGYTTEGYAERVFHVHVHRIGDNDEIYFRDYLIANPDEAKEYEALKLNLASKYRNNRDAYTNAKTEFVRRIVDKCRMGK